MLMWVDVVERKLKKKKIKKALMYLAKINEIPAQKTE